MGSWRQTAQEAKDLLTVCLAKAIDRALADRLGADWFADFAREEEDQKPGIRLTQPGQRAVQDLDLQALLKLLRYRSALSEQVLSYYGFCQGMEAYAKEAQTRQLNALLDRLISDFRNRIEAHSCAADIERELAGQKVSRIYGYEEAYQDMYKLCCIFSSVADSKGRPYHRRIAELTRKKSKLPLALAAAAAVLALAVAAGALFFAGEENAYVSDEPALVQAGQLTVQPIRIDYEGDELVAVCYIINGTDRAVKEPQVRSFELLSGGVSVAKADFGALKGLTLEPGSSVMWKLRFPEKTISAKNIQLNTVQFRVLCEAK